jgi:histidine triad (HIT) family protein
MSSDPGCIFCQIAKGAVPATVIERLPHVVAIRDVNPQAPDHILVFPTDHIESLAECDDIEMLGQLLFLAAEIARKVHIDHGGYRVVVNTGDHGGQTVPHLHLHLLGGRRMKWPPG